MHRSAIVSLQVVEAEGGRGSSQGSLPQPPHPSHMQHWNPALHGRAPAGASASLARGLPLLPHCATDTLMAAQTLGAQQHTAPAAPAQAPLARACNGPAAPVSWFPACPPAFGHCQCTLRGTARWQLAVGAGRCGVVPSAHVFAAVHLAAPSMSSECCRRPRTHFEPALEPAFTSLEAWKSQAQSPSLDLSPVSFTEFVSLATLWVVPTVSKSSR